MKINTAAKRTIRSRVERLCGLLSPSADTSAIIHDLLPAPDAERTEECPKTWPPEAIQLIQKLRESRETLNNGQAGRGNLIIAYFHRELATFLSNATPGLPQSPDENSEAADQSPDSAQKILWVGWPDSTSIEHEANLIIRASGKPGPYYERHPMLIPAKIQGLEKTLGRGLAAMVEDADDGAIRGALHQGVLTMEFIKMHGRSVKLQTLEWLEDQLKQSAKRITRKTHKALCKKRGPSWVIFLHSTMPSQSSAERTDSVYKNLAGYTVRCFPSKTETVQKTGKIGGIQALDQVASEDHMWRPITCADFDMCRAGACRLSNHDRTVIKQSTSCGGADVHVITSTNATSFQTTQPRMDGFTNNMYHSSASSGSFECSLSRRLILMVSAERKERLFILSTHVGSLAIVEKWKFSPFPLATGNTIMSCSLTPKMI